MHTSDIMKLVVNGIVPEGDDHVVEEAVDTVVDPICGMSVALTADAITLEHEGVTYGFCGSMCRDMFIEQQAGESAQ
jgi:YHS domain-containing protein